jgi:hypothetical protein
MDQLDLLVRPPSVAETIGGLDRCVGRCRALDRTRGTPALVQMSLTIDLRSSAQVE